MAGTKNRQHRSQLATVFVAAAASSLLWPAVPWSPVEACTSILVSKGASADGSTMITYAADSHELYGSLEFLPAGQHAPGEKLDVHDWDHGTFLGKIPQVEKTFSVVGLINERQVAIGETTFGGREELVDPNGGVDYGSLMKLALQRAATAREAIRVIDELAQAHGYASKGESFSISDPTEVWLMEMVGKGPEEKGMVWVARRIPDGHVSAHANQARIRTFPRNDPASCLFSPDVVSFARKKGYFAGKDEDFSFADAYAPLDGESLRVCEARVWNVFRRIAPAATPPIDYVLAVPDARPLPLWVRPEKKLAVADVIGLMRDHFEGTPLDLSKGVGAGPYALPYRWRPMTWVLDGVKYVNERAISTQQTGFSLLAQARSTLPDPVGGVLWFGVDDTYSTVYLPFYCGLRSIPRGFAAGVATLHTFSWESAFWIFNWVANFAYSRYSDMIGDIQVVQRELESGFFARQAEVDSAARALYAQSPELARDYLTRYSLEQ
ncbi:MAG: dipeptidase, partial [Deltaproteobacteria bacterium]|nr:dipeptidase [Deltaproteobacteria bacterium]